MHSQLAKYNVAFTQTVSENKRLKKKNSRLETALEDATSESTLKKLRDNQLRRDYEDALAVLERIPPEVLNAYARPAKNQKHEISLD